MGYMVDKMRLRELRLSDVSDLYALIDSSRGYLMNLKWSSTATFVSTQEWIIHKLASHDIVRVIEVDHNIAGMIELRCMFDGTYQIGYWLAPEYRGFGHAQDALKQILKLVDLPVIGQVYKANKTSLHILTKAGFKVTLIDDTWIHLRRE